jgi:hypothetical protein
MPRYFFHVVENSELRDDHGIDLPDERTAKLHGVMMLGKILREEPQAFWASGQIGVTATTDDGVVLFILKTTVELATPGAKRNQHDQELHVHGQG